MYRSGSKLGLDPAKMGSVSFSVRSEHMNQASRPCLSSPVGPLDDCGSGYNSCVLPCYFSRSGSKEPVVSCRGGYKNQLFT